MLAVKKKPQKLKLDGKLAKKDIIFTEYIEKETFDNKNRKIIERIPKKRNITKSVNETKKVILNNNATEKLRELEEILNKGV